MLPERIKSVYNGADLYDDYRKLGLEPPLHLQRKEPTSRDAAGLLGVLLRRRGVWLSGWALDEDEAQQTAGEVRAVRVKPQEATDESLSLRDVQDQDRDTKSYVVENVGQMTIHGDLPFTLVVHRSD